MNYDNKMDANDGGSPHRGGNIIEQARTDYFKVRENISIPQSSALLYHPSSYSPLFCFL